MQHYDLIGDIHGHAAKLRRLLAELGYREQGGVYRHPHRQAIFLGDFIDRGPDNLETVAMVRAMVEDGAALAVMGNHEFNALAYHTPDPDRPGEYLRRHTEKNQHQHSAFLAEVRHDTAAYDGVMDWFWTLPVYLDLPGFRVVHACWHPEMLAELDAWLTRGKRLSRDLLVRASREGRREYTVVEMFLKGLEVALPAPHFFLDKDGHRRERMRVRWWDDGVRDFAAAALPGEGPGVVLGEVPLPAGVLPGYAADKPVFFGHYWLTGAPAPLAPAVACVDYSAGKGGPLCAYRWRGERLLDAAGFVGVD
jgi:hypothetical protein